MSLAAKARRAPLRIVTGAYILNSGVSKLGADDETAKTLQGFASGTYPVAGKVEPKMFAKGVAVGEVAVGAALLLPIVPPVVAGAALVGFSGALLNLYWRTPGMHEEGNPRPTQQGTPIAKDVWLLGMGAGLIADALIEPAHDKKIAVGATVSEKRAEKSRRAKRKAAKSATKAAKQAAASDGDRIKQARKQAMALQAEAAKRAQKAAKKAKKRAAKASDAATKRLADVRTEYGPAAAEKAKQAKLAAQLASSKARERIAS